MKHLPRPIPLLLALLCLLLLLPSCERPAFVHDENRVIAKYYGAGIDGIKPIIPWDDLGIDALPYQVRYSDLIVLATVNAKEIVSCGGSSGSGYHTTFRYTVTVDSILHGQYKDTKEGDSLTFESFAGYIPVSEFHYLAAYEGVPDHDPLPNEYYAFCAYGLLPYEVGRQFVIFLDEITTSGNPILMDSSEMRHTDDLGYKPLYPLNFCYESKTLYYRPDARIWDGDLDDLKKAIKLVATLDEEG